jgi:hypothetical protein
MAAVPTPLSIYGQKPSVDETRSLLTHAAKLSDEQDGRELLEVEFPPLLGGEKSKSQFDDFDNIQELDRNKDWTMLLAPMFLGAFPFVVVVY